MGIFSCRHTLFFCENTRYNEFIKLLCVWCVCGLFFMGEAIVQKDQETLFQQRETRSTSKKSYASCMICLAAYVPSRQRSDLLHASPLALESAFMSMCHFCFRCRRPSCPECWDYVHGLCAACSHDANLPFRTEFPPLNGALLSPLRQAQSLREQQASSPLVCIRPGTYTQRRLSPIDKITTRPELPLSAQIPAGSLPRSKQLTGKAIKPVNVRPDVAELKTRPVRKPAISVATIIVRAVTWSFLVALLGIVALIALALFYTDVNAYVFALLRIDIRLEIAYLLQLFYQLFS